jgi:hypothetical protein
MGDVWMTPPMISVVEALVDGAVAWSSPDELTHASGLDPDEVIHALAALVDADMLVAWDQSYTLTLTCAESMGLEIEDFGLVGHGRWVSRALKGSRGVRLEALTLPDDDAIDLAADPRPGPLDNLLAIEYLDALFASLLNIKEPINSGGIAAPRLLLTGSANVWRETVKPLGDCVTCHGGHLAPYAFCLRCCRWGMDGLVKKAKYKRRERLYPLPVRSRKTRQRKRAC